MKIIAIEHEVPNLKGEDFQPYIKAETRQVWELYKSGLLREIYFRADRNEAVLVLECENSLHAEEILSSLPLVKADLIRFELIPLKPYPGFERLFEADEPEE